MTHVMGSNILHLNQTCKSFLQLSWFRSQCNPLHGFDTIGIPWSDRYQHISLSKCSFRIGLMNMYVSSPPRVVGRYVICYRYPFGYPSESAFEKSAKEKGLAKHLSFSSMLCTALFALLPHTSKKASHQEYCSRGLGFFRVHMYTGNLDSFFSLHYIIKSYSHSLSLLSYWIRGSILSE